MLQTYILLVFRWLWRVAAFTFKISSLLVGWRCFHKWCLVSSHMTPCCKRGHKKIFLGEISLLPSYSYRRDQVSLHLSNTVLVVHIEGAQRSRLNADHENNCSERSFRRKGHELAPRVRMDSWLSHHRPPFGRLGPQLQKKQLATHKLAEIRLAFFFPTSSTQIQEE